MAALITPEPKSRVRAWLGHRVFLASVALALGANGLWMLSAPAAWFAAVPGASETGPFNHHFVRDVGAAYLTIAAAVGLAAAMPAGAFPLLAVASLFLASHALLHAVEALIAAPGPIADAGVLAGVFVPPFLLLAATLASLSAWRAGRRMR